MNPLARFLQLVAALAAAALSCGASSPLASSDNSLPAPHYRSTRLVTAWLPYWLNKSGQGDGWKAVQNNLGLLDQVSFFSAETDPDTGTLKLDLGAPPATINSEMATLHEHDVAALLTITLMSHVHDLLNDPVAVRNLKAGVLAAVNLYNFDGIDVDFEDFHDKDPGDAALYSGLLEDLAQEMHARLDSFGYPSTVAATILARTDRGHFTFADEQALAASDVDQVRIMAYDQNWPGSSVAGADAPLPWVQSVASYLRPQNQSWKFIVGVPAYGDRWPVASPTNWATLGKGASVTYPKALAQMQEHDVTPMWSDSDQAPYLSYTDDAGRHMIAFYENARSWRGKLDSVIAASGPGMRPLGGMAEWALGDEDPAAWREVAQSLAAPWPVYSAIGGCYTRFGGGARFGEPVDEERDAGQIEVAAWNDREGRRQQFERAMLYYKWGEPRAYYVEEPILDEYLAQYGASGSLGFPVSDPVPTADHRGVTQQFQHGKITASICSKVSSSGASGLRLERGLKTAAAEIVVGGALYAAAARGAARRPGRQVPS